MTRISSNMTLVLKVFLPVFWFVFYGAFAITLLSMGSERLALIGGAYFKYGYLGFFVLGSALLFFTVMKLKRLDMSADGLYLSNYFKTFRYSFESIEKIDINNYLLFKIARIYLKEKGRFGKRVKVLVIEKRLLNFIAQYPERFAHLSMNGSDA